MAMAVAQAMPAQQMQVMAVQCPPDSGPGQQIVVNANGQQMSVVVPDREKPIGGSGGSLEPPGPQTAYAPPYRLYGVFLAPSYPLEPPG